MSRPTGPGGEVLAAGGIVVRPDEDGLFVAVVHRPHRGDWSFPKGHVEEGEQLAAAALREVEEETGFRCRNDHDLGTVAYVDARGRPKVVAYWAMSLLDGEFSPNAEVDELRWCTPQAARQTLSYDTDRAVLGRLAHLMAAEESGRCRGSIP